MPEGLLPAMDCGVIEDVVRPLMSGKEAQVYVVVAGGRECVAKVYKEASQRSFKHRAEYTEGRRTRNSRDQRAISKRSRHGRSKDEAGWRSTEVDMIHRLRDAGVRVPELINFVDGVVVMELVQDADGCPAPRLGDLDLDVAQARAIYHQLLGEVTKMLCAGVIHGDLSEFNVLMAADGPVLIDFPQSLDAARNQNARRFLLRDVENLHRFVRRHAPGQRTRAYAEEMWSLYEANRLQPDTNLRGDYQAPRTKAHTGEVLALIEDADREEHARREARGEAPLDEAPPQLRKVVDFTREARSGAKAKRRPGPGKGGRTEGPANRSSGGGASKPVAASTGGAAKKRRGRRRRKGGGAAGANGDAGSPAHGGDASLAKAQKRSAGPGAPGEAGASRKRRRRRRTAKSGEAGDSNGAMPGSARRSPHTDPQQRAEAPPAAPPGDAQRPSRRRRRRPRNAGSR